jgi:hypothetical protein
MLVDAIGQFAGTFVNPVAGLAVLALAAVTQRPAVLRLSTLPIGALAAALHLWSATGLADLVVHLLASVAAVLLQVELLIQVAFPILALARRLLHFLLRALSLENTPPSA